MAEKMQKQEEQERQREKQEKANEKKAEGKVGEKAEGKEKGREKVGAKGEEKREEKGKRGKVEEGEVGKGEGGESVKASEAEKEKKEKVAYAKALDLPISKKAAVAICKVIRGKSPYDGLTLLEQVIKKKKAIPMVAEIGHRKRGHRIAKVASGRYPEKAARYFIKFLKQGIANARQKGIEDDKMVIGMIKADKGATRYHYGRFYGRRFKSTNLFMEIKEKA
jgi:large subunit ribosomal protein L22